MNKYIKELQKGCGEDFGFFYSTKVKRFCGAEFPKGWTDKRHDLKKYPREYCFSCQAKIKKGIKDFQYQKLKRFYNLYHEDGEETK